MALNLSSMNQRINALSSAVKTIAPGPANMVTTDTNQTITGTKTIEDTSILFSDTGSGASGSLGFDPLASDKLELESSGDVIITTTDKIEMGTTLYVDSINSRVGINVPVPTEDFEIDGNIQIDTAGLGRLVFYDKAADHEHGEVDADDDGVNGGQIVMKTKEDGGSVATRMVIRESGRIGMDNTAPNAKLHIGDDIAPNPTGDVINPALQIGGLTTYRLGMFTTAEGAIIANTNGDDGIQFQTKTFGEALRINAANGYLGVRTNDPQRPLHLKDDGSAPSSKLALESTDISSLGAGNQGISWRNTTSNGVGIVDTDFVETGFVGYNVTTNDNATFTNELKLWNMVNGVFSPKLILDQTGQVDIDDSIKVGNDATSLGGVSGSISGSTLTIDGANISYGYLRLSVPATSTITTLTATNIRQSGQLVVLIEGSASGTLTLQGSDAGGITNAKVNFTADIEIPNNTNALLTFFNGNGNIFISAGKYL